MTHAELIAALEAATDSDRELDAAIAEFLGYRTGTGQARYTMEIAYWWDGPLGREPLPRFTGSLDAAVTLIPNEFTWNIGKWKSHSGDGPPVFWADVHIDEDRHVAVRHVSAPISVCIAALRARQAGLR